MRWGSNTHTHLRIEDSCSFCNTTVLKSTHIDCTIYSSLYSKIQRGVEFCARLRDGLVSLKDEHGEEKHTVHSILQPYTQHNLHSMLSLLAFTFEETRYTFMQAFCSTSFHVLSCV